ncbi:coatomer epsilon subunit-domain-containing protein [Kockovaella imperatae]|uniref:Coatomer subunit epsilon n=1 Tax=Kockovaella imperatae TaxID=4999 RepID=A0A1Y1U7G7_9TREE|nr:coatomer epsilon subunit-domain-containing protein [Kockovaella imperatae]ORX33447.1 coatomer epsilon subunit-domain-containing protein [Kockovaella imperatae]
MEADPLFHVKQLFYQAAYKACIAEASSQSLTPSESSSEPLLRSLYIARSHLALSPPATSSALSTLKPFDAPSAKAVSALAEYLAKSDSSHVDAVRDLVIECEGGEESQDEGVVRVIAGTIFILEGENEEAVATLTEGAGKTDLECNALLVQLLLSLNRRDLALSTYNAAKRIGNDSLLVQAMEAWIGLKAGARPLHQSYYFYEELYQLPNGRTPAVVASHAASHLLLGHLEEAKADIQNLEDASPEVLAVAKTLGLAATLTNHPFALDLESKSAAFDSAAANFIPA